MDVLIVTLLPNSFWLDVEASIIVSENLTWDNRKSIDFIKAILGECNYTYHLSTVSVCKTVQLSTFMIEYVQNFAEFPGVSYRCLPSPASTKSLSLNLVNKSSCNRCMYVHICDQIYCILKNYLLFVKSVHTWTYVITMVSIKLALHSTYIEVIASCKQFCFTVVIPWQYNCWFKM